ncbi:tape measure domain-containing protein [Arthrobacter sp. ok909]|uniref:tape measure protein n=1 Tax=Arthrobacter sp. ok909 TaxID=1761746 RepID=UPI00088DB3AE|nr:tape measure protein [Arthrobacter sp. ok909]SDP33049.1 tape measure domain-containing protein [Arthrobacter sp. ok909]
MPTLSNSNIDILIKTTADTAGVQQTEQAIGGLNEKVTASGKIGQFFADNYKAAGAASAGLLTVMGLGTKAALDQASAYQQNRVAFETMLGSADRARTLLKQVSDFAAATPFQLPDVVEGAKKLLAFGVAGDDVISTFRTMGNIAAGVGTDKLPFLINVFGQVKSAGRLMSQDLLQFTSAGVPIIDLLAQHFGTTTEKVRDMVQNGQVGFADLKTSLELLGGPAGKWGDLMDKQSKTFGGTLSNVQDQLGRVLRQAVGIGPDGDIRQGSLFDVATKGATLLLNGLIAVSPYIEAFFGFFETHKVALYAVLGALGGLVVLTGVALVGAFGGAMLLMAEFAAAGAVIAAIAYVVISNWNAIGGFFVGLWTTVTTATSNALNWLKENWLSTLGFLLGFFALLPYKLPFYMFEAISAVLGVVSRVDWGGVFSGIGRAISGAGNDIINAIGRAYNYVTSLNWGVIMGGIGRGIGNGIIDLINGGLRGAFSGIPVLQDHIPQLPHFAAGVRNFAGGLAVVGERGPELVNLPRGADVYSNSESRSMAGGGSGGVTINNTNHIYNQVDLEEANAKLAWSLASA